MPDGLWLALAITGAMGQLMAGVTCAAVEVAAVLTSYLLLGRYLAFRSAVGEGSEQRAG